MLQLKKDLPMRDLVWFSEVSKSDVAIVGGKGANLGEMTRAGLPVPNGFIVTSGVYFEAVKSSGAYDRIRGILYGLNIDDPASLANKARACQQEIKAIPLSFDLQKNIARFYKKLSGRRDKFVAVRSSATAEDLPEASFAGQQATFLNVRGIKNLNEAILAAWASLFEARAIFYRVQKNFDHFKVGIAIPVEEMVRSEVSGVMFTQDPITNDKNKIVIEAIFGLGELIVGGQVTPDHYEVNKKDLKIDAKNIVSQEKQLVSARIGNRFPRPGGHGSLFLGNRLIAVSVPYRRVQKLADEKIIELADLGKKIEKHYFFPQDIEWAYEDGTLYIVQTRPITTLGKQKIGDEIKSSEIDFGAKEPILTGAPASPKIACGKVVIIKSPKELYKVTSGSVLVTEMTNPDYVVAMKKAVAVVTDRGGRTSHAAIVSRELGIACVVGCEKATKKLKDGMIVTVDGAKGLVFEGNILKTKKDLPYKKGLSKRVQKTATKLYVNLAEPDMAREIAAKNVDGVGLLRAEFVLAQIGTHPKVFIEKNQQEEFVEKLKNGLVSFAKAFSPRPIIYRASDFKSNEYSDLRGGDKYEPKESNPMLGYRGAFRYVKDPDVFKLELEAISRVREKYRNFHLMVPFVRSPRELQAVREIVSEKGLFSDPHFKFWMMVEIPTNVILLEKFIEVGIDGVSIGSNDLTMLILGVDRDNEEVASEFWEMDEAVLWALEKVVRCAAANKISCSICGQAPSTYPELTEKLVAWGITSISVNPDVIDATREIIYQAEHKLISKK